MSAIHPDVQELIRSVAEPNANIVPLAWSISARLLAEDEVAVKPDDLVIRFVHLLHDSLFPPARALYTEEGLMALATDLVECLVRAARSDGPPADEGEERT